MTTRTFAVAMTGASGAVYGLRLVDALTQAGHGVHLMISGPARRVLLHEDGLEVADPPDLGMLFEHPDRIQYHQGSAVEAAPASGSAEIEAVILCPCSMGTLGRVAHGYSSGLIERAADVALKEGRKLILVPRETPLSLIHLENMATLARAGAILLPAMPGFYHRPESVEDLVRFVVAKVLHRLGVESSWHKAWKGPEPDWEEDRA